MLTKSTGTLRYSIGTEGPRLVVEVDPEIARYSRSLIPKHLDARPPRYPAHITVVRKEPDVDKEPMWGAYEGLQVEFSYLSVVNHDDVYFWLCVESSWLRQMRVELCLPEETEYTKPPDGRSCFHITVATRKHLKGSP